MIPKLYTPAVLPDPLDLFGQLIAQAPFAIWMANNEGKVILFNEAMKSLVGIEDPEKILEHYNIFGDPIATAQGLVPYIKRVLDGQIVQTVVMMDTSQENFGNQKEPKVFYVRCLYFPLKSDPGETEFIVMLVENITQSYLEDLALSKATHQVEAANKEVIERENGIIQLKHRLKRLEDQLKSLKKV
jgi:PAS domain-containing protein